MAQSVIEPHNNDDHDLTTITVAIYQTHSANGKNSQATINTTSHHLFYNDTTHRWTQASDLKPGDHLHDLHNHDVTVQLIHNYTGQEWMRDLTVETTHTCYVIAGTTPVLVHNCGTGGGRRGNAATRDQLDNVRDEMLEANLDWKHVAGGRDAATGARLPERAANNPNGPGVRYPDLTFELTDGSNVYVNTVDTYSNGATTIRELEAALDITEWGHRTCRK